MYILWEEIERQKRADSVHILCVCVFAVTGVQQYVIVNDRKCVLSTFPLAVTCEPNVTYYPSIGAQPLASGLIVICTIK